MALDFNLLSTNIPAEAANSAMKGMGQVNALTTQRLQNQAAQMEIQNALAEQEAYKGAATPQEASQRLMQAGLGKPAMALNTALANQGKIKNETAKLSMDIMRERTKDLLGNTSNENYIAHLQEGIRDNLITPEQAQQSLSIYAAIPPNQRKAYLTQQLTKAEDIARNAETERSHRVNESIAGGHLKIAREREQRLVSGQTGATLTPDQNNALFGENGAVSRGLIDPARINSRNAKMWADAFVLNPNANPAKISQDVRAAEGVVKAFASGAEGKKVTAFNTAIDHLETLEQLGAALKTNDVRLFNDLSNRLSAATGQSAPTNFSQAAKIVGGEISKAIVPGVGTGKEREEAAHAFNTANSPEQLVGAISTAKKLMGGQLKSLDLQYKRSTKREDFADTMLTPSAKSAYQAAKNENVNIGNIQKSAGTSVSLPNGQVMSFPTPEAAAQFKQAAGL